MYNRKTKKFNIIMKYNISLKKNININFYKYNK